MACRNTFFSTRVSHACPHRAKKPLDWREPSRNGSEGTGMVLARDASVFPVMTGSSGRRCSATTEGTRGGRAICTTRSIPLLGTGANKQNSPAKSARPRRYGCGLLRRLTARQTARQTDSQPARQIDTLPRDDEALRNRYFVRESPWPAGMMAHLALRGAHRVRASPSRLAAQRGSHVGVRCV
ncbi:hypothetical protein LZ30DRAFT_734310 [Colletotrichum cereale]|nr:hypothetical protein LZ30DRAFT_734310 [Colletotrichum cereale]